MDLHLDGKTAIVTGASQGIGLSITETLAREGAFVIAAARSSSPELDELHTTGKARAIAVDLTTAGAVDAVLDAAGAKIDILVNNVGGSTPRQDRFAAVSDEQWLESLTLNTMTAIRMCRAVLPAMLRAGAALWSFAKALSKEVGPHGIWVNTVSPGPVATRRWRPDQIAAVASRMITGRLTSPEEIADVVAVLASDRTANVTGTAWAVDGGLVPTL